MSIGIIRLGLYTLVLNDDLELSGDNEDILVIARSMLAEIKERTSPACGDPRFYALEKLGEMLNADSVTNQFIVDEDQEVRDLVY